MDDCFASVVMSVKSTITCIDLCYVTHYDKM